MMLPDVYPASPIKSVDELKALIRDMSFEDVIRDWFIGSAS
jgi:hypothetical protein